MNPQTREQRLIRLAVIAAVIIVPYIAVINPAWKQWTKVNEALASVTQKLEDAEGGARSAEHERELRRELAQIARLTTAQAPLTEHTALMIRQIETLPHYSGLQIRRLEALPLMAEQTYARTAASLQFSGSLEALQLFLTDLDNAAPRLLVDRTNLSSNPKTPNQVEGLLVIYGFSVTATPSDQERAEEARAV